MLVKYLAEKKIKKFLSLMARSLPQRYGGRPPYTHGQVLATVGMLGYDEKFHDAALVVFCYEENYEKCGLSKELVKKYRGYRNSYISSDGGAFGGGDFSAGDGGGGD